MRNRVLMMALATVGMTAGFATPASAQATRTWVSGTGDDVNPCSRTAPCKTFAGAISKTAAGGEINCLDPGGFGAVTITKSMTISCPYTEGGALAGGNGIVVNDSATATPNTSVVFLRGLDIFGVNPPSNGVRFVAGAALHIEDSTIRRFNAANSLGVSMGANAAAKLYITRTTISDNGSGATGGGIEIKPAAGGSVQAVLTNVRSDNNANNGLRADTTSGAVTVVVEDSTFSGNTNGIAAAAGLSALNIMLNGSVVAINSGIGILASGATARLRVSDTTITGNGTGLSFGGGAIVNTYQNNRLDGNGTDGAFTAPSIPLR